jgi:hypothetical protein
MKRFPNLSVSTPPKAGQQVAQATPVALLMSVCYAYPENNTRSHRKELYRFRNWPEYDRAFV